LLIGVLLIGELLMDVLPMDVLLMDVLPIGELWTLRCPKGKCESSSICSLGIVSMFDFAFCLIHVALFVWSYSCY